MTNREFCHWIEGFAQLADDLSLDEHQIRIIKNHADLAKLTDGYMIKDISNFIKDIKSCEKKQHQFIISKLVSTMSRADYVLGKLEV
ncbi:hypothetical protein [Piscirickettsia salmonis]|uniref:hypothetical protein n=1 Tax=Piscirickettsia salmonis TaxID=1238 RepID=UPI0007C97E8F|nr:hypothetical protein A0O36_02608 [Piscirickettsiaceae bacterium NZ-RLO1]